MKTVLKGSAFSNALLAGLLTGIIAAVANLAYSVIYRDAAHFDGGIIVMPFSIFIGFPILLALIGCSYYLLSKYLHVQQRGFILFCLGAIVLFGLIIILDTQQNNGSLFSGFRGLCLGLLIITFSLAAFFIPYLSRHPDMYK